MDLSPKESLFRIKLIVRAFACRKTIARFTVVGLFSIRLPSFRISSSASRHAIRKSRIVSTIFQCEDSTFPTTEKESPPVIKMLRWLVAVASLHVTVPPATVE